MGHKTTLATGSRVTGRYGEYEITEFDGAWRRATFHPYDGGPSERVRAMHDGTDDASPHHLIYGAGYDARCACCWLNITHTDRRHARALPLGEQ